MLQMDVIRLIVCVWMMFLQTGRANSSGCGDVTFVSRSSWGASSPRSTPTRLGNNLDYYIIHHTDGGKCSTQSACSRRVRGIQSHHKGTRGWNDIGYNFLIGGDNRVYVGRGWDSQGAHTSGFNANSIGISIIGNYNSEQPPSNVMTTLRALRQCGVDLGHVKSNYNACGHQDFSSTICPGTALRNLVNGWGRCNR